MHTRKHRVLVVDPDPAIRALIVAVVRRGGHTADAAATAEEALELERSLHPAAVIVEPRMTGGQSLMQALQQPNGGRAPALIIVTTPDVAGKPRSGPAVRAILHKPFGLEELVDVVSTCCDTN